MDVWTKIRNDYIKGGTSYQKLAQKYGVSYNTLAKKAGAEEWTTLRQEIYQKSTRKTMDVLSTRAAEEEDKIHDSAMQLLDLFNKGLSTFANDVVSPGMLKDMVSALSGIQKILQRPTEMDIEEQRARIDKLRKEAERDNEQREPITIHISDELEDYAQ